MPRNPIHELAQASVCAGTAHGWLWYCDEHDSHGNADSESEARAIAGAHQQFHADATGVDDEDVCEVTVWQR